MELPLAKIKRIAKFDPDVKLISNEGAAALALSCEMFIKSMAESVYQQTRLGKRKTVQMRDVDACLQNTASFSFLEGALETWTDVAGHPGAKSAANHEAVLADDSGEVNQDEGTNERAETSENGGGDTLPSVAEMDTSGNEETAGREDDQGIAREIGDSNLPEPDTVS